jgi:predicted nucleotide-binding protein
MKIIEVEERLFAANFEVTWSERLSNDLGDQLRLTNGAIVNVFDTGKVNVQGKNQSGVKVALGLVALTPQEGESLSVFISSQRRREELEAMLKSCGLTAVPCHCSTGGSP